MKNTKIVLNDGHNTNLNVSDSDLKKTLKHNVYQKLITDVSGESLWLLLA